ncbi:serine/threonine-protein kinase [Streptomonospora litoralis]|uniref:Serine/threonine-protein kinase AfsK n=1 Tax=Streptomonospora litoralis TaxID=2498135 RepID=A0A4P6PVW4_9ACTN|nr:hypothetical protein [Streptomonospora litoralis]QBI52376.1 Serine/threonine-protein kinase AfsK [Streptomonospora litoralis]
MSAQYGAGNAPHPPELRPLEAGDPQRVGDFTLLGRLAEDSAGVVYGAHAPRGGHAAVRVAAASLAADPGFRSAFARRASAMRGVSGVCVLPLLAADPDAGPPWLATAYPAGPTLRRRVESAGPLTRDALFALATGTAEALAAAHAAGLAYGRITPDDVVLAADGPRILGLDAAGGAGGSLFPPEAQGSAGAEWASPESAAGAEPAPGADVFSWGCLVAYAARRRHPFAAGGDTSDMLRRIRDGRPDLAGMPDELSPLIEMAVAADAGARPSAESAYRGLVAFASTDDTAHIATPDLGDRLRGVLASHWQGVGAASSDEAAWAAATASAGTASATGSGTHAAQSGPAAGSAAPAAAPAPDEPSGRRAGALATAVVTACSMAGAIAIGVGGYLTAGSFAGEAGAAPSASQSASSSPAFGTAEEAVAGVVETLRTAAGYRAVDEVDGGDAAAAGERREYVLATLAGQEHFQSVTERGSPEEPEAGSVARIYSPESDRLISREYGGGVEGRYYASATGPDDGAAWRLSRKAVLAPFQGLRESMDVAERIEGELNGTPGLHVSGTFDGAVRTESGQQEFTDAPFDLWVGVDGRPLRLAYTAGGQEHSWDYSGFDGLDSRICGVVEGVPDLERAYLVPTRAGTACGDVRPVVEEYLAIPPEEQQAAGYVAEVGEWTCRMDPVPDGSAATQGASADVGACYRGPIGAAERVDLVELQ